MKTSDLLQVTAQSELGPAPIASVSDAQIWKIAVTPMVKALLGPLAAKGFSRFGDSTDGLFPGDEVSNLNSWSRNGVSKVVRFPYLATYYRTAHGAFIVKRDWLKIKAFAWFGDVLAGKPGELIFSFGLRDRRFDGTPLANDSALLDFPYDEPQNKPLIIRGRQLSGTSLETSLYSFFPQTTIAKRVGDEVLNDFIAKPYTYSNRPKQFLRLLFTLWQSQTYPGQVGVPIFDVGKNAHAAFEKIATACGYDFLETAPSHLHVYGWNCAKGYECSDPEHEATINAFKAKVAELARNGQSLTRVQESWLFVMQSLGPDQTPERFYLGGLVWPQNNIDQNNLWLHKPLSSRAKAQIKAIKKETECNPQTSMPQ